MKRSPLLRHPKAKGNQFEKLVSERLKRFWPNNRRNLGSGAQGGGDLTETVGGFIGDYSIECKKREKISIWASLAQAEKAAAPTQTPLLVFARNRSRIYAAMPLDDLEGLWMELKEAHESLEAL